MLDLGNKIRAHSRPKSDHDDSSLWLLGWAEPFIMDVCGGKYQALPMLR